MASNAFFGSETFLEEIPAPDFSGDDRKDKSRKYGTEPEGGFKAVVKTTSSFKRKGQVFFVTVWTPKRNENEKFRGLVFLCHGYCEYLGKPYEEIARIFASRNILVFGHDHLGHGQTTGERAQIYKTFQEDYVGPILDHCQERKRANPGVPLALMGHSLGGLMSLLAVIEEPKMFDFCIVVGPLVTPSPEMATPVNVFLAKWLSFVMPAMEVSHVNEEDVTRDEEWVKLLKRDPMFWHGGVKLRQGYAGLKALKFLESTMSSIQVPILIQHGTDDKICLPDGSKTLYEKIGSEDKKLKLYEKAFHNLLIELDDVKIEAIHDQVQWLEERLAKGSN